MEDYSSYDLQKIKQVLSRFSNNQFKENSIAFLETLGYKSQKDISFRYGRFAFGVVGGYSLSYGHEDYAERPYTEQKLPNDNHLRRIPVSALCSTYGT